MSKGLSPIRPYSGDAERKLSGKTFFFLCRKGISLSRSKGKGGLYLPKGVLVGCVTERPLHFYAEVGKVIKN